jgi:hypothetical protein
MDAAEVGFAAVSRAVVAAAADLVAGVERRMVGAANVRTAQGNAWEALCADRARARAHADIAAMVAALTTGRNPDAEARVIGPGGTGLRDARQRDVGSSPRSSASQAALVSSR